MYTNQHSSAYAVAIFDLVKDENKFQVIQPQFEKLLKIIHQNPELIDYLKNDMIDESHRLETIDLILKDFDEIVINAVKVIVLRRKASILVHVIKEYLKHSNSELRIRFLKVVSAFPLTDEQLEKIKQKMQKVTRRTIELVNVVDPNLISGFRIESRTEILESSVQNTLEKLKQEIINNEHKKGA
ncbi:ATP synthase F1 subunit delta [Mycoplasma corogypsi]|uniref:ATP synthase F1 subunit delta n=1 Tax=Mycoplasma corogypsi TaxID=2106 RepID=UPI003873A915